MRDNGWFWIAVVLATPISAVLLSLLVPIKSDNRTLSDDGSADPDGSGSGGFDTFE